MADKLSQAYDFLKSNGPSLPVRISKVVGTNIMMASVLLSQLVSEKKIKLTNENIGGSPLYYIQGQESFLQDRLGSHLTGKKKEAFNILKEKKVLNDQELEPAIRIALREIKDFAVPIDVNLNGNFERFWRWYLITNEDVKNILFKKEPEVKQEVKQAIKETKIGKPEEKRPEIKEKKIEIKKVEVEEKKEDKKEIKKKIDFYLSIDNYFSDNKIEILNEEIVKKDKEFNFLVEIPSNLGRLKYFVKVRNKKKINEGDLSLAYNEAQAKSLPLLFLTNGDIAKKAKEHLDKNLSGIVFKKF